MKLKEPFSISLNVDWRMLLVLGILVGVLAIAYSAVGAQNGGAPNTNDPQPEKPEVDQPVAPPVQNDLHCAEGLLLTTNGECIPADFLGKPSASQPKDGQLTAVGGAGKHVYLTYMSYAPNTALTACASGYHMASLWEILDVSNLTYDFSHPAAYNKVDSGYGPPSHWYGWVRTGFDSSGSSTTGTGNCLNWTDSTSSNNGVAVRLSNTWETDPGDISTWDASSFTCNIVGPVWCAGN